MLRCSARGNEETELNTEGGKLVSMLINMYCSDFAAEHADLSVGTIRAEEGWTLLLPRTDIGLKAMMDAANNGAR